tara:strand:- start:1189 stop:2073 length:885 start_codon:yes stop_codon:yes gene_type:complete
MLPDNFDFAMLPPGSNLKLSEIGMLASSIESIDYSIVEWLTDDLELSARTNEGWTKVPVLWQSPERAFQIKNDKELRDSDGAFKLPLISIERTNITKDPTRKGSYQAHTFSQENDGRSGRIVLAKRIVQDKTRNFAVVGNTRATNYTSGRQDRYFPRINKKIVIQTLTIPIPVYINVEYKISIKTEYQQQMNDIVTPFMARTGQINSFILRRNGHKYEAFIDQGFNQNNNAANLNEDSRMYTTEINIRVLGYLIGEGENDDRPIVRVDENFVEITFPQEGIVKEDDDGFFNITS